MQQYPYSGSDDEMPEQSMVGGQPSSILHAPGENTLRKNFQVRHNKHLKCYLNSENIP